LRGWSDDKTKQIPAGAARASGADGDRAPWVGRDGLDRQQVRDAGGDAAPVGAPGGGRWREAPRGDIPVVLHVHSPEGAAFRNLHRFATTEVLFCSEHERRNFQHLQRFRSKTEVLYNTTDVRRFAEALPKRRELGLESHQVAIGTIAQISKRKGIDLSLEVARLLPDDHLVFLIVGPDGLGEEQFAAERRTQAVEDPALRSRVRFLGPRRDIQEFLKSIDLFVLPTRAERFGIVIVEAMASGVSVVATNTGGVPEFVTSGQIGRLVSDVAPAAFAGTIAEVRRLPHRAMAGKAQDSVRQRFDRSVIGEELSSIYDAVLGLG
jgi:glycosyltransferase involved in cell wall biosynthesis